MGACWIGALIGVIGAFDPAAAREILRLAPGEEPVAFTPLGWPADTPGEKRRKPIESLIVREKPQGPRRKAPRTAA